MNNLTEIISNAFDLAGGNDKGSNLTGNAVTLYALNVLADMELELSGSARGLQAKKFSKRFELSRRTGSLSSLPTFIRYKMNSLSKWQTIPIVSDVEDLTQAEAENRQVMLIYGVDDFFRYELSFTPSTTIQAELWGAEDGAIFETLEQTASVPEQFGDLAATRIALVALDDLLRSDDAARLMAFIQARKTTLAVRLKTLNHWWLVYRSNATDSLADVVVQPYNPFDDYGHAFELN